MNRSFLLVLVLIVAVAGGFYYYTRERAPAPLPDLPDLAPVGATLLDGLGDYRMMNVTNDHPEVQQWFDQAVILTYGFNHDAAERSFLRATELDPACAMCWWGAALVLGPHVNAGMDPANNAAAWERLQAALALAPAATEREQAYIQALSARYAEHPPEDRTPLDIAYAEAMDELARQYPDDLDASTLYAEALMDLQPWDFWDESGRPKGNTPEIVATLESVIERNPDHAGALHLYIHAVEASDEPERGAVVADRLRGLIPGSGHLVHMPAHIYARVGRWHDAVLVNQDAIESDDLYLATCRPAPGVYPLGYVPHNHHFLWFAATMAGESEIALGAAEQTLERIDDPELMRMPGLEFTQHFALSPIYAKVRFGHWEEITETPRPHEDFPLMNAVWHYAQGMAAVRQDRLDDASEHHGQLAQAAADPEIETMLMFDRYPLSYAVNVAEGVLAAEIAMARDDFDTAIAMLETAVDIEDRIPYDEPPGWHAPVRLTLGYALLAADRPGEAEAVYRAELRRNPDNGWSLFGLEQALLAQDRTEEAAEVAARFANAWAHADFELSASRL